MRKVVFALFVVAVSLSTILSAQVPEAQAPSGPSLKTIAVGEIHTGMRGVAYTVFQGIKPEAMDVEVLGVLRNVNGPKGDIILVRLHGTKVEYTGVVAGMSGSPVYIDGKLAGALAFRIGEFSKEPIAGVTPIADMLEINGLDRSPAEEVAATKPAINRGAKYFAVDVAPTDSRPPSPVAIACMASAKSRIARPTPREASSAASPAGVRRMPVGARSNSFSPTLSSRPLTRAVSAAGVTFSAAAAWTSEPASAIA